MKTLLNKLLPWCLMTAVLLLLLFGMDQAFQWYESAYLVENLSDSQGPYALNELGYHHHHEAVTRTIPGNTTRILSFGDSFAYAVTTPPFTYAALLEKNLARQAAACPNGAQVEVVNLGLPAISFPEYIQQGRFWTSVLDFDAMVLNIYAGNDFVNVQGTMVDPAAARSREVLVGLGARIPNKYPLRFMDYLFAYAKTAQMQKAKPAAENDKYDPLLTGNIADEKYGDIMRQSAEIYAPALLAEFPASLHWCYEALQFAAAMQQQGKVVRIAVSPPHLFFDKKWMDAVRESPKLGQAELDPTLPVEIVRRLAVAAGLDASTVIDLSLPLQAGEAEGHAMYLGTNTHWTVEGNEVVAKALSEALLPALMPLWGCRAPAVAAPDLRPHRHAPLIDAALASIREAEEFGETVLTPLAAGIFGRQSTIERKLDSLGLHKNDNIVGLVDSVLKGGERGLVWLEGWTLDTKRPAGFMRVVAFLDGRLVGSGIVNGERLDVVQRHNVPAEAGTAFGFHFQVDAPLNLKQRDELWVLALDTAGGYNWLQTTGWTEREIRTEN